MGKVNSVKPIGNFYLRPESIGEEESIVYLRYYIRGRYAKRSTSVFVPTSQWDNDKQRVKPSSDRKKNDMANRLNAQLKSFKDKVDKQIEEYDGIFTYDILNQMLKGEFASKEKQIKETNFIEYCLDVNQKRFDQQQIAYSTYNNSRLYIGKFQRFFKERYGRSEVFIIDIQPSVFEEYKSWSINLKEKVNLEAVNKTLTPLFKGIRALYSNGLLDPFIYESIYNQYLDIKQRRYDPTIKDEAIHYLTPEHLEEFTKLYHKMNRERTKEIMEMFLFSVNTALRVSDLITLEWKNIDMENCELRKIMYKTKLPITIHLNDVAIKILNVWKKKEVNDRFVFNLLDENFDLSDIKRLDTLRLSKNKVIQTSLRAIGRKLNLSFNLTIHVARHTFAVLCLKKGLDIYQISKLLGHSSIVATEKTYAEYIPKDFKEMSQRNLDFGISINTAV